MSHPLPWITPDPMQAVIESNGAQELHAQQEQDQFDRAYEHTPADERPLFPPTFFPVHHRTPTDPPTVGAAREDHRSAPAPDDSPVAGAAVPTTSRREQ